MNIHQGVGLGTGVGVAANVGVGTGVCVSRMGIGVDDATATFSGICELSKNIPDSILLITFWSNVSVIGSEISLGTLSDGLAVKAR